MDNQALPVSLPIPQPITGDGSEEASAWTAGKNYAGMAIGCAQVTNFPEASDFLTAQAAHFGHAMAQNDPGVIADPDSYFEFMGELLDRHADRFKRLASEIRASARRPATN